MIYIDILTYEFADISENTANLPLDWPYQSKHVYDSTQLIEDNWVRLTEQGYEDYITDVDRVARYNTALAYSTNSRTLRISSIIDDSFSTLPIDKIDFRRHLKEGICLNKVVVMLKNGRPSYCTYEYDGTTYVRIRFEFTHNSFNLVTNKKTWLGFYNTNGDILHEYILTDETTDLSTLYGLQKSVNERYQARSYIFDEIKSYVNAVILQVYTQQVKSYEEVLAASGNFWKDYSAEISSWCHIGGTSIISDKISTETKYEFLDLPSGYSDMTLREWIINRITY